MCQNCKNGWPLLWVWGGEQFSQNHNYYEFCGLCTHSTGSPFLSFFFASTVGNLESSSSIMSSTTTGDFLWKEGKKKKGTAAVAKVFSIDYWSYRIILFQIISVISIAFVVASTVGMTLNTIPSIQHRNAKNEPIDNPKLALIEAICISWFTIEYLLRLAGKLYSNSVENCPV